MFICRTTFESLCISDKNYPKDFPCLPWLNFTTGTLGYVEAKNISNKKKLHSILLWYWLQKKPTFSIFIFFNFWHLLLENCASEKTNLPEANNQTTRRLYECSRSPGADDFDDIFNNRSNRWKSLMTDLNYGSDWCFRTWKSLVRSRNELFVTRDTRTLTKCISSWSRTKNSSSSRKNK